MFPARSVPITVMELDPDESCTLQEKVEPFRVACAPWHITPPDPDSASVIVPVTVREPVLTDAPFEGLAIVTNGGVMSRFTCVVIVAVLFAVSATVPETAWLAPSALTMTGGEQLWIGAGPGVHVNVTIAAELFHQFALGAGRIDAVISGF